MANNMFAILVSGRMVDTNFIQVGEKQCLINIPDADNVHHVAVFLTGSMSFPDGYAGLVYFSWPDPNAPPNWQLLGFISNEKPSSIFKISTLRRNDEIPTLEQSGMMVFAQHKISHSAQIGISVESNEVVQQQANMMQMETARTQAQFMEYAQKMMENFLNYTTSFSVSPTPNESYVPMNAVANWYKNFERKFQINPNFWKS